ncbi:MAG: HlyD family secretion protein [Bryobacteraceae bacterium]|jgi:membrane fusion protein (multidrug efflux system)
MADLAEIEKQSGQETNPTRMERRQGFFREHPRARWGLLAAVILVAAAAYAVWSYYSTRESTDDAQIDGHINPISAKVGGTVLAVHVNDNQYVEAGALLVEIDARDYQVSLEHARADAEAARATARAAQTGVPITSTATASRLSAAQANVEAAQAGIAASRKEVDAARAQLGSAQARLREVEARSTLAQQNLARMKQLVERDEIPRQQYDTAVSEAQAAAAAVDAARAAVAQAEQGVPVAESHVAQAQAALAQTQAGVRGAQTGPEEIAVSRAQSGSAEAKAELNRTTVAQAELNLQYTRIMAPVSGVVSRKTVEVGQVIQPGQPLLAVVPLEDVWVTANFKETQLKQMRPGQPAAISVDAYGGREFRGHVDSMAAATGARFSVLPPENASGNYVKVVQRVPVKIVLERDQDPQHRLRPGMSVEATVFTK